MQILYSFEQAREVNVIFFILQFLEYSDNNKIYRQGDIILQKKFIERQLTIIHRISWSLADRILIKILHT